MIFDLIFDQDLPTCLRSLPTDEVTAWTRRLERHRNDCGCRIGLLVMLSVTGAWLFYPLLSQATGHYAQRSIWMGSLVFLVSGLIGKIIGLAIARVRFNLTVRDLRKRTCG
ncbi:MAG TPA: hypothetical protein VFA74_02335 [Terriglobales bacterium]|nr:hypothetical protein [Terriglobales bacterium]